MKYSKFNKYEQKAIRKSVIQAALAGGGQYLYQNSSKVAELTLPRPTKSGLRKVGPEQQFQGDDYYMQMVKSGDLRLVEVLQTAEQEQVLLTEEKNMTEKLILEQPAKVTSKGVVEHVVEGQSKKNKKATQKEAVVKQPAELLLNESPVTNVTENL